jgi:hypothetical protein
MAIATPPQDVAVIPTTVLAAEGVTRRRAAADPQDAVERFSPRAVFLNYAKGAGARSSARTSTSLPVSPRRSGRSRRGATSAGSTPGHASTSAESSPSSTRRSCTRPQK